MAYSVMASVVGLIWPIRPLFVGEPEVAVGARRDYVGTPGDRRTHSSRRWSG